MLFALTLWVLQISTVFSNTELYEQMDESLSQIVDMIHQSHADLRVSIDVKNCQSESHSTCENEHCVNCLFVMTPLLNDLNSELGVTRHVNHVFKSPQQYLSIFYRPPQII